MDPPADFERHEYVAVEESQGPLSFVELSEEEKKVYKCCQSMCMFVFIMTNMDVIVVGWSCTF